MKTALLIVDMMNTFDFPNPKPLLRSAMPVAENIQRLKKRAKANRIPVIYVNDNFGHWKEDWKSVYEICAHPECPGAKIATLLKPEKSDYFILKPRHSGFYYTSLQILLDELKVKRLIITGIAGNICVWFTANDAHMLDYEIWVPQDCVASNTAKENDFALSQMKTVLSVKISSSTGKF